MIAPPRLLHLIPTDARRAGLVVVVGAADDFRLAALCAGFADQGYEVMAPPVDDIDTAVLALCGPVVVLAIGQGAIPACVAATRLTKITAVSLFDPPAGGLDLAPACPMIVHLATGADGASTLGLDELRARWPDLVVYPYRTEPGFIFGDSDAAQLARLRTLQLFHRAGGKAEMGG